MYLGSDEFNNAIENTNGNAPKIRVTLEDGTTLDNIKSIKFYGGSNDSDDVSIGTTNMARIDVTAFTDKMLTNNEIFLEQGIELADGVVEYMPIGYFTVQKPQGDIDEVRFTAYDRMQKFEKPYSSSLAYPTTSILILNELCQICGIELATTLDNAIEVTENLKGYTCREVLGYIASMHSSFACIDRYGRLNVRWYSNTPIEKSLKKIWHFEKSQDNFEIAKVEIAKDSETNYVSGNGITTLHNSNPLATQEIADDVFVKLGGFSYSVGEIEMLDDARLDPWDMVSVEYYDGKTYNIPCMTLEHDFKAYSTTVKSVGKSESENEYRFTGPTIQYLNRMAADLLVANRVIATKVDAEYVNSVAITTENFDAKVAEIQELIVEEIDGKYANIDLANVEVANIGEFFARSGILENVLIEDGAVTGTLKGVHIIGDVIEANTIKADSLILSGSEESLIYQINVNASGLTAEQLSDEIYKQKLSGTDLVAQSVTTNELAAGCITTEKIQAGAITTTEIASNTITGNNLASNTITSREINVDELFAQEITATGSITGATIVSIDESVGIKTIMDAGEISFYRYDRRGEGGYVKAGSVYSSSMGDVEATGNWIFDSVQTSSGADLDTINGDYVSKTSGANTMAYDYECHVIGTAGGSFVYAKFATVKVVNPNYANAPIRFQIIQRGGCGDVWLSISGSNTIESHTIAGLEQNGALGTQIYAVISSPGVFDLYMDYAPWEHASVTRLEMSTYMRSTVAIDWKNEFVSSLPSGYITANRHFNQSLNKASFGAGIFGYDATGTDYTLTTKNFIAKEWVRTEGSTGWYSNAYGGGLFMQDETWIRTFGNKGLSCDQTIRGGEVVTYGGANLNTIQAFVNNFEFANTKKLSFLGVCYYNNTGVYGFTIRWGSSSLGVFVDDTYWLAIRWDGLLAVGIQSNGATYPTWYEK